MTRLRFLTICLVLAVAATGLPPVATSPASAAAGPSDEGLQPPLSQPATDSAPSPDRTAPVLATGELPEQRTATTRTLRNVDGSYTLEAFSAPVHYRRDGRWEQIDTSLTASRRPGYAWQNRAAPFETHLKDDIGAPDPVALVVAGQSYSLTPETLGRAMGAKGKDSVRYRGVAPATDLEYRTTATGLKETLTLSGPQSPSSFSFIFRSPAGTSLVKRMDGSVAVVDPSGATAFSFDAPWAKEHQAGRTFVAVNPDDPHASLTIAELGDGQHRLILDLDPGWLRAPGRRFPVTVDPTATIQPDPANAREGLIFGDGCGNCPVDPGTQLSVGTDISTAFRGVVAFDTTSIPMQAQITEAPMSLYWNRWCIGNAPFCYGRSYTVNMHQVTAGPWWDPSSASFRRVTPAFDPAVASSVVARAVNDSTTVNPGWDTWDAKNLVQRWVNNQAPNLGVLLKVADETLNRGGVAYEMSKSSTAAWRPKLSVTYTVNNATHGSSAPPPFPAAQVELAFQQPDTTGPAPGHRPR